MMITRTATAFASVVLVLAWSGRPAHAVYYHLDALGLEVQHQAEALLKQFRTTELQESPQFSALTADAYEAYRRGGHVRQLAVRESSMYYVKSDLYRLRQLIADMERLTQDAELSAAQGQFGSTGEVSLAASGIRSSLAKLGSSTTQLQAAADAILQPVGLSIYVPGPVLPPSPVIVPRPILPPPRVHHPLYRHVRPGRFGIRIVH